MVAEAAMMFCTSRQPRLGLASSISATTPATIGVESDVPLNPFGGRCDIDRGVDKSLVRARPAPVRSVVTMFRAGAVTRTQAP